MTGTEFRLPTALARGTWFWQLRSAAGGDAGAARSPTWQFTVVGNAPREARWHGLPDINGDGRAELIVGAPSADGGAGRVFIYDGAALDSPRWTLLPPIGTRGGFGTLVCVIGDLDGDGFAELAVRSVSEADPRGSVSIYRGGAMGPSATSPTTERGRRAMEAFGEQIERGGDIDGDGRADWLVTSADPAANTGAVEVFFGASDSLMRRSDTPWEVVISEFMFPRFIASGDIDDDGYSDVISGATDGRRGPVAVESRPGVLAVARGSSRGLEWSSVRLTTGREYENGFAASAVVIGDVNDDGYLDLLVGLPTVSENVAYLFSGNPQGIRFPAYSTWRRLSERTFVGVPFVAAGDLNNDGHPDWIREQVQQRLVPSDPPGRQIITSSAPGENIIPATDLMFPPGVVAAQADYTGDGIADLVIGDPSANTVSIYAGRTGGPSATPTRVLRAPSSDMIRFGASIAR